VIRVTNDALQMFGARGYSRGFPMEWMAGDARMFIIGRGAAQRRCCGISSPARDGGGCCRRRGRVGRAGVRLRLKLYSG